MPRRTALRILVATVVAALAGGLLLAVPASQAARPGTLTGIGCIGDLVDGADTDLNSCAAGSEHLGGTGVPVVNAAGTMVYVSNYDEGTVVWFSRAADGTLAAQGCIADAPAPVDCAEAEGLDAVWGLRLSSDGHQLYAASYDDGAVVRLDVAANGSLTNGGCIGVPGGPCAQSAAGLANAYSVDVSADGADVYVGTWRDGGGIVQLRRASSGALTPTSCVAAAADSGCAAAAGVTGVSWLDVSPDGRSVYAASYEGAAVAMLSRNTSTGALTSQGCLSDSDVVTVPSLGCAAQAKAVAGAQGIAVSADGASVYVAANADGAVTFLRRGADGRLTDAGCVQDVQAGAPVASGCAQSTEGLDQVNFVTVSPDDDQVLTGSAGDNAVATFNRAADGALGPVACIADSDEAGGVCATNTEGLNGSFALGLSPNGRNVYVGGYSDHALVLLKRDISAAVATLAASKKQKLAKLRVTLRSDARATTKVTGTAVATYKVKIRKHGKTKVRTKRQKFALQTAQVALLPATSVTAKLHFKKARALRKLLAKKPKTKVTLTLTATTTNSGGATTTKSTVRVVR